MSGESEKVEPAESEQDEEEDVYEVERIIDMRVEEGEVLYRVRWKNYCSDDDTWEPEAHLEDCREVLLSFKKTLAEAKAKKEADVKKTPKLLPTKSDVFDADSESDSEKDRPTDAPLKKKKKKTLQEDKPPIKEKKKKKKEKRRDDFRPLPAPETDEESDVAEEPAGSPHHLQEKKTELKKRVIDTDEEEDDPVPSKKVKKDKGKEGDRQKKERGEEGKKKKGKKERKLESSEDEAATAPLEDDLSDGPSQTDGAVSTSTNERISLEDKFKLKKGRLEVRLQGIKGIIIDKKSKKIDASTTETPKRKSLASKNKDDAPHSDSSDSSTVYRKSKSKGQEGMSTVPKAPSSSTSSSSSSSVVVAGSTKSKEDETVKEEMLGPKDATGSVNLFEKFLLNCEAKDRAPRRPAPHQPLPEKSSSKPNKLIGRIEKIQKSSKDSPPQKPEMKKMEKSKQSDAARAGQSHGFSLDSDEIEGEDLRERKERPDEAQRASWDRRTPADDKRRRREDSEPRLFMACDDNQDGQDPSEAPDKCDKGQATLSLGMDLNLDWMTLDDFQKHLNGEDEILSGPPLSPSELRDAVKSGDYMAVKLALNSKEEYNLDQEFQNSIEDIEHMKLQEKMNPLQQACTIGEMKSFEAEESLSEERSTSDALRLSPSFENSQNEDGTSTIANLTPQILDFERGQYSCPSGKSDVEQVTVEDENVQKCGNNICNPKNAAPAIMPKVEEQKDQEQVEGDRMSHDKAGGSSSEISWIFDHLNPTTSTDEMATNKDMAVTNGKSLKESPCEEANESQVGVENKIVDQLDNADEIFLKAKNKEITATISQSQAQTVAMEQPTRSSLRTRKKVFCIEPDLDKDEIKEPGKKHFCLYCKGAFAQIEKHLEKRHAEETAVVHAIHFPKGSKVRQSMLNQIRDKGDYEHNCQVVRSGEREVAVKKQGKNPNVSVRDFLPCQHCFAFYRKTDLWRHEQSCKVRKADHKSPERTEKSGNNQSVSQLYPVSDFLTKGCEEIIGIMHQDDISKHIRSDPLICSFGNVLSAKYENDKSQFAYIAQKMRELGRFVLAVNELDSSVKYLHEVCIPSRFELAVEGAKKVSGFDPSSSKFKTASLVTKVGYSLKRAAEIAFGESRMTEDSETERAIKKFIHMLDTKWSQCFSRKSLALSMKQDVKKVEIDKSSVTEDLIKLHRFITEEEDEARRDLKERPSLSTWKKLSEATLADVCLFNRGRVGNIGRMLLQTYLHKKRKGIFLPSADQIRKSTKLELHLGASFTRLELEGQFGRNMLVLLTERIVLSVDSLIENRQQAGVSNRNPYLFARTEGPSFIRGLDCFRRAAIECGVKNPEALLSASLREQIACCWQLMSLGERELDQVAELVGRSRQDCYRLSHNPLQLEEVSKRLLKMDRTGPTSLTSTSKDGNAQKSALKRRPWSEKEQSAVKRYLCEFITKMKVPGKKECNACIAAEPDLNGRSWTDIKNYVHNTLQTMRRRTNQQKSGGNTSLNPRPRVRTKKKNSKGDANLCNMTTVHPDHLTESSDCCMTIAPPAALRESSEPFHQDLSSSYASLCSTSASMVHTSQPLISTFTALNATDTQVVPTFTPHNTTNALMPSTYSSESSIMMPMSPPYTQHATNLPAPSDFAPHDTTSSSVYSNFTTFNAPSTSMVQTFAPLNTQSSSMAPAFSTLNNRNSPIVSSFTPLNHPSTPAYNTPTTTPATAQVVPTIHRPSVSDSTQVEPSTPISPEATPPVAKPQKRIKRLWSEEEQAAVRRQFGDFSKLIKVPGKKDCDACLVAEPALNSRTWREVKYFVHNSIQSLKRRGQPVPPKHVGEHAPETHNQNPEWDGPVYLSL